AVILAKRIFASSVVLQQRSGATIQIARLTRACDLLDALPGSVVVERDSRGSTTVSDLAADKLIADIIAVQGKSARVGGIPDLVADAITVSIIIVRDALCCIPVVGNSSKLIQCVVAVGAIHELGRLRRVGT